MGGLCLLAPKWGDPCRPEDDAPLVRQDGGDASQRNEPYGLPIGDDEDQWSLRPPRVWYSLDDAEMPLRRVDAIADRHRQASV
jgi:hypothetical protein